MTRVCGVACGCTASHLLARTSEPSCSQTHLRALALAHFRPFTHSQAGSSPHPLSIHLNPTVTHHSPNQACNPSHTTSHRCAHESRLCCSSCTLRANTHRSEALHDAVGHFDSAHGHVDVHHQVEERLVATEPTSGPGIPSECETQTSGSYSATEKERRNPRRYSPIASQQNVPTDTTRTVSKPPTSGHQALQLAGVDLRVRRSNSLVVHLHPTHPHPARGGRRSPCKVLVSDESTGHVRVAFWDLRKSAEPWKPCMMARFATIRHTMLKHPPANTTCCHILGCTTTTNVTLCLSLRKNETK